MPINIQVLLTKLTFDEKTDLPLTDQSRVKRSRAKSSTLNRVENPKSDTVQNRSDPGIEDNY